jgi:thymidylate synthase (FAD)
MKVSLQVITPDAEKNIVEIARVSSPRVDKTEEPEGLIRYLIRNKHWSPFEHASMTFEIETSKAIGIQLLRHVSFRFQEFSQRYAKVDGIEPIEFRLQAEKNRQSSTDRIGNIIIHDSAISTSEIEKEHMEKFDSFLWRVSNNLKESLRLYEQGLELGIAKECMRFILPMATSTKIYMTGSIRSWIHCLEIRDDKHAQLEVQHIAKAIKNLFIKELPIISNALNWKENGTEYTERGKEGTTLSREGEVRSKVEGSGN